MNYNEFAEKIKAKYPEYNDMDNRVLAEKMVAKFPNEYSDVTFDDVNSEPAQENKGIDLTPTGMIYDLNNKFTALVDAPIKAVVDKQNLKSAYNDIYNDLTEETQRQRAEFKQSHPVVDTIINMGADIAAYSQLPLLKGASKIGKVGSYLGNAALQGGLPMGLEALKRGDNALSGFGTGTSIGLGLQSLPYVGKVAKPVTWLAGKVAQNFGGLKPETLSQVIKPNSKALDMTKVQAERLALDTTERLRDAYSKLKSIKGQSVANAAAKLTDLEQPIYQTPVAEIKQDITNVFDKGQYGKINPLRDLEGKTEAELNNILNKIDSDTLTPEELLGLKREIGDMTNWDVADARNKNRILEQIYGKINNRLNNLSPELQQANKEYAKLFDLLGERSRLRTILNPKSDLETATSKLKNYKSTNDNIYELENQVMNELGEAPILNQIDDANATIDLLNSIVNGRNLAGNVDWVKDLAIVPSLKAIRKFNQLKQPLSPFAERLLTPTVVEGMAPLLYGEVTNY